MVDKLGNTLVDKLGRLWVSCEADLWDYAKDSVEVDMSASTTAASMDSVMENLSVRYLDSSLAECLAKH